MRFALAVLFSVLAGCSQRSCPYAGAWTWSASPGTYTDASGAHVCAEATPIHGSYGADPVYPDCAGYARGGAAVACTDHLHFACATSPQSHIECDGALNASGTTATVACTDTDTRYGIVNMPLHCPFVLTISPVPSP